METKAKQNAISIKNIKNSIMTILPDFKKAYVYFYKNPEVNDFQNNYENIKNQIMLKSNELFSITKNINTNIQQLNKDIIQIDIDIQKGKKENIKLKNKLPNIENDLNGTNILKKDSKLLYILQYYSNVELICLIVFVIILFYYTFSIANKKL